MKGKKLMRVSLQQTVDSVIVHDIKNLALRLSALLQNMEEHYESPLFRQNMEEILKDTVDKLDAVVTNFRTNQKQVIVKLITNVNQILKKVIEDLPHRKTRGIALDLSLNELPSIWGDPFYLHKAFQSLVQNALDAMPEGGILKIHTRTFRQRNRDKILIEISDNGMGMTESFMQNSLFNPFITTKEDGLGLGLFTSQQIFALHRGKIDVMSTPGSGTTFRILLPVEEDVKQKNSHH
jgi:signal transduction histidine kinase